jgi:hypothetical protein
MRAFIGLSLDASTELPIDTWRNKVFHNLDSPHQRQLSCDLDFFGECISQTTGYIYHLIEEIPRFSGLDVLLNQLGYWA